MYSKYYFVKVLFIIMTIADFIGVITSMVLPVAIETAADTEYSLNVMI